MADQACLNARVRALWGRLFSAEDYDRLLGLPDLPALVAFLHETPYGPSIASIGGTASDPTRLEEGLRRHLSTTFVHLRKMGRGDLRRGLDLLLGFWEVQTLITLLRGIAARMPVDAILAAMVPTGLYDEAALAEMARQPDLPALLGLLTTWRDPYARALAQVVSVYREPRDLYLLETALQSFYFRRTAGRIADAEHRVMRSDHDDGLSLFITLCADRTNLMTALKFRDGQIPLLEPHRYFVPGGWIYRLSDMEQIASARDLPEAVALAARSRFESALRGLLEPSGGMPFLIRVERALDRVLLREMRSNMRVDPLGWGPAVCFVLNQVRETVNLRLIAQAIHLGREAIDVEGLLILKY